MRERIARATLALLASALIIGPSAAQGDNCSNVVNLDQDDTDGDDCGNLCDADYNQSGVVDFGDYGEFMKNFGCENDSIRCDECECGNFCSPLGDYQNCEEFKHLEPIPGGTVGFGDFGFFVESFAGVPGPSDAEPGTTVCP
jgi:hypothetical protein